MTLALLALALPAFASGAAAQPRGAMLENLAVSPAAVAPGESVDVSLRAVNNGQRRSSVRQLLVRLKGPGGNSILTQRKIKRLRPGESKDFNLSVAISASTQPGDHTVIACRARQDNESRCGGRFREEAPLEVREVRDPARIVLEPTEHDFGSHATGTRSSVERFAVVNLGAGESGVPAAALGGADPGQFEIVAGTCEAALPPSARCHIDVAFAPASTGAKAAGLGVAATPGGSAAATLAGAGVPPAKLSIAPGSKDFGDTATGTTSATQSLTVTNTGGASTGAVSTSLAGADAGQFAKFADGCAGKVLAPGASCTLDAAFGPTSLGAKAARVDVSGTPGGSVSSDLEGEGIAPANLTISPSSPFDFGDVARNDTQTQNFTVTNNGAASADAFSTDVTGDAAYSEQSTTCGATLGGGQSCTITVQLLSATNGTKNGSVSASATPGGTATSTLEAEIVDPANLTISPLSFDFGDVAQNDTQTQNFTVTNNGAVPTGALTTDVTGDAAFSEHSSTCPATLGPTQTCTITVQLLSASNGTKTGAVSASATPGGTASSSLDAEIVDPANLTITPDTQNFGDQPVNTISGVQSFTVGNDGGVESGQIDTSVTGSRFTIASDTCDGQTLGPGDTCAVGFQFAPLSGGAQSETFNATASPGGSVSGALQGTGLTVGQLQITPASHDFGDVEIGTTSQNQQFTIENVGEQTVTNAELRLLGASATSFQASGNTCGGTPQDGFSLAAGATCTVNLALRLTPPFNTTGAKSGQLEVRAINGSQGGSDSSTLSGTGVTPANLQVSITTSPAAPGTYGSSASLNFGNITVESGLDQEVHAYIWFRNTGGAGATVTNDPVTFPVENAIGPLYGQGSGSTTCKTITSDTFPVVLDFFDPVIAGGSECRQDLQVEFGAGAFSYDFTVQSTGGNVSGTITGNGI